MVGGPMWVTRITYSFRYTIRLYNDVVIFQLPPSYGGEEGE